MSGDVLTFTEGALGRIRLNRPSALHALTQAMCRAMTEALRAWRAAPSVRAVLIDHAPGTRGFCSGGDIRFLAEDGKGAGDGARAFFFTEYRLNCLLHEYPKPIVAVVDGVVMGGGVGISAPARFRVATERTTYAMPETGIGLFPDVGGGWYLPRLNDQIGIWLALTGARIKAGDCLEAGVVTHYVRAETVPALGAAVGAAAGGGDPAAALAAALDARAEDPGGPEQLSAENRARIARAFSFDTVEEIIAALHADGSDWARAQLAALETKSPQTLKVALRQMRAGARLSFAETMAMEYRIAGRVIHLNDFQEGVRAVIVDKDNAPRWRPQSLEAVTPQMLDALFAPLAPDQEWTPLQ